jgi:hypothetical protein
MNRQRYAKTRQLPTTVYNEKKYIVHALSIGQHAGVVTDMATNESFFADLAVDEKGNITITKLDKENPNE